MGTIVQNILTVLSRLTDEELNTLFWALKRALGNDDSHGFVRGVRLAQKVSGMFSIDVSPKN
jgi:hypothetical protein